MAAPEPTAPGARTEQSVIGRSDFAALVARHRQYFRSGATRSAEWREAQLRALRTMVKNHAAELYAALWSDLRRNRIEADWADVKYMTSQIGHALAHLRQWMKPRSVSTPLVLAPSHTLVRFDPLGVGLILGTWNYPVNMVLSPLVAAISAGNTAVIKPSELAPATAAVIARLVPRHLDQNAFSVVLGGPGEAAALLEQHWDHIFFTGGTAVARIVMAAAAKNLTPVVLELGGKNPTIVHSSANLRVAARRIACGRCFNAGQTCTAPDYVLVFKDVAEEFLRYLKEALVQFYGDDPQKSPDFGRIVSARHFDRVAHLLDSGTVYHGGLKDRSERYISPTVLVNVSPDSPVMQEEVFGPVLPVLEVGDVQQVIDFVNERPNPLGLYVFAEDKKVTQRILDATTSGDAVVNDCTLQPLIHDLPFGGVGASGMGKYHGEWGFRAYSNARGVLYHSTRIDFAGVRYPPYDRNKRLRDLVIPS
jgi:acyl-CoA reductase-like NAD-dependent aldehyde dehydrogenase